MYVWIRPCTFHVPCKKVHSFPHVQIYIYIHIYCQVDLFNVSSCLGWWWCMDALHCMVYQTEARHPKMHALVYGCIKFSLVHKVWKKLYYAESDLAVLALDNQVTVLSMTWCAIGSDPCSDGCRPSMLLQTMRNMCKTMDLPPGKAPRGETSRSTKDHLDQFVHDATFTLNINA